MNHLVTLSPALDITLSLREPSEGKIGEVIEAKLEPGGKALNLGRFMNKLNVPSTIWLGTGGGKHPTQVLYRSLLTQEGVDAKFLSGGTPVRMNAVIQTKKHTRKYNHPGCELDLLSFSKLDGALKKDDRLVMTGRLPQGMNPGLYASWIRAFGRKGIETVVDTSGEALAEALRARPWFFKVNLFELSEALHRPFSSLRQIVLFLPNLIKMGLLHGGVTHGEEGALLWNGNRACWVQSSQQVRTPLVVGAGDGFLAGYFKGLQARRGFEDCAKFACAAGTAVALSGIGKFGKTLFFQQLKKVKVKNLA